MDTNVLVYADDPAESVRQPVAQRTLETLLSTRTGDGQVFDGITVENPFRDVEATQPDR